MKYIQSKLIYIAIIIAVFLAIRLFVLSKYSPLWIDEYVSINAACGDPSLEIFPFDTLEKKLIHNTEQGILKEKIFNSNLANDRGNALVFDYFLSGWLRLFGCSFHSIKSAPVFLFLIVLLLMHYFNRSVPNGRWLLLFLILLNPLFYRASLECRTYMLSTLMTLLLSIICFKITDAKDFKLLPVYITTAVLALFCHFLIVPVLIWHFFIFMKFSGGRERSVYFLSYVVLGIILLVLLYVMNEETGFIKSLSAANQNISNNNKINTAGWNEAAGFGSISKGLLQVLLLMFGLSLQSLLQIRYFAILIIPLIVILYYSYNLLTAKERTAFYSLIITHVLFLIIVSILSGNNVIFQINYSIFMLPYYLIYISRTLSRMQNSKTKYFLSGLIIITSLAGCIGYIIHGR
jgi:hypothetical protein